MNPAASLGGRGRTPSMPLLPHGGLPAHFLDAFSHPHAALPDTPSLVIMFDEDDDAEDEAEEGELPSPAPPPARRGAGRGAAGAAPGAGWRRSAPARAPRPAPRRRRGPRRLPPPRRTPASCSGCGRRCALAPVVSPTTNYQSTAGWQPIRHCCRRAASGGLIAQISPAVL